jgi:predicted aspartyl protease
VTGLVADAVARWRTEDRLACEVTETLTAAETAERRAGEALVALVDTGTTEEITAALAAYRAAGRARAAAEEIWERRHQAVTLLAARDGLEFAAGLAVAS